MEKGKWKFMFLLLVLLAVGAVGAIAAFLAKFQPFSSAAVWNYTAEQHGNLTLYRLRLDVLERYGLEPIRAFNLYLHHKPEQLERIPARLELWPAQKSWIAYDSSIIACNDTLLAAVELGYWLGLLGINVSGAVTSAELLNGSNERVKSCVDANENVTVILVKGGAAKASLKQEGYCIVLQAEDCRAVEIAERFILALIRLGLKQGRLRLN